MRARDGKPSRALFLAPRLRAAVQGDGVRVGRLVCVALLAALTSGCQTIGYLGHVSRGHAELLASRQPIAEAVDDPAHSPQVRGQLAELEEARRFATEQLRLPGNRSYTHYVALDRPYVSWSVMAAPELSLEPLLHCFPFAGCVPYRGYFQRERAETFARSLQRRGYETHIGGTPAYSTLGWFADPVVSSMLREHPDALIGTVFHELTHQKHYVRGDTAFNESLATFVEQQGLREWRALRGGDVMAPPPDYRPVIDRVLALREALRAVYASERSDDDKRRERTAAIAAFRADYALWRAGDGRDRPAWDAWVAAPIDNAKLLPFGLYDQWVPAFEAVFDEVEGDWSRFHAKAAVLAAMPAPQRAERLDALGAGRMGGAGDARREAAGSH
jgi:predicted aminopeptidase